MAAMAMTRAKVAISICREKVNALCAVSIGIRAGVAETAVTRGSAGAWTCTALLVPLVGTSFTGG
jgi:hypothetical protein